MGTTCPTLMPGERPTRLRVILPFFTDAFNGKVENYLAESILLGWDDVPAPPSTPAVRTFKIRLKHLTVVENGEGSTTDGDWRVFVNVGGQWRYMSNLYDAKSDGTSTCNGADSLTNNGTNDCYSFENTPWTVSVTDGTYIHVAVGGYESDPIDGGLTGIFAGFCRTFPGGCDAGLGQYFGLYAYNDDRIGTFEFDLDPALTNYAPPGSFTTEEPVCHPDYVALILPLRTCDELRYQVEFSVDEVPAATPPASQPFQVGDPHYGNFVSSATPFVLSSADANTEGFQYRFHHQGDNDLPIYPSTLPFPVHWAHADLPTNSQSVPVYLNDGSAPDGLYDFQYSAQNFANLLEPRHAQTTILDNTPPVITIVQPTATQYPHSATLTLNFSVSDGTGSGVQSSTPKMDGLATLMDGTPVANNLAIHLLTELSLGMHTFTVNALDNVGNPRMSSVTFAVIVTPESIKGDVTQFLASGAIKNRGQANSLLAKLDAAAAARARGQCSTAANLYQAFINELQAQSGKGVDPTAAQIMILDAQYLIAHCP
jgi:hypothetical protein